PAIAARAGLQGRPVAIDQDVRGRRFQGVGNPVRRGRQSNIDSAQLGFPGPNRHVEGLRTRRTDQGTGLRAPEVTRSEWDRKIELLRTTRRQIQVVLQGPGGVTEVIAYLGLRRQYAGFQVFRDGPLREGRGTELLGWCQRDHALVAIDPDAV